MNESPSQTAGPYVHIGCMPNFSGLERMFGGTDLGSSMVSDSVHDARMTLSLTVLDAENVPLTDAMLEIWQPGPDGTFGPTEGFTHWGRQAASAKTGTAFFDTLRPGASKTQAPHILVWIAARGINLALITRIYLPDADNSEDAVFQLAGTRAKTMVAEKTDTGYAHTIRLNGSDETVFLDV